LNGRRHFPHFVEEEHAAARLFDLAGARCHRTRERTALHAEQFRLDATTSLPVPDSPAIRTVVSVAATFAASVNTWDHRADSPSAR